jgi:hypothetical protein
MARELVQVFVIQCVTTGEFLTSDLEYSRSLKRAGRLFDFQEAVETAHDNLDYDFEISSFHEFKKQPH